MKWESFLLIFPIFVNGYKILVKGLPCGCRRRHGDLRHYSI
ncbi:hypothetical protein HMPREF9441_02425 [Paraprevotella clara YIT 11840]|uniref:Uncharacterized protein n=1 Tax=Paraprevotella clara YIT 11840 TaxID=762968 RepID=G5SSS5_9BACT|nr:hypothetical protein HMPREF9441_02425 [Paraprevotella clara YIT 11840]